MPHRHLAGQTELTALGDFRAETAAQSDLRLAAGVARAEVDQVKAVRKLYVRIFLGRLDRLPLHIVKILSSYEG